MATYKKPLYDKDGNQIYPDVGLELDEVIYGDDPGQVETPSPWIETGDIKDNQITSAKIDWTTIDYSSPILIGKWVNGKPLYRKVVSVSPLPNASSKNVAVGVDASHIVNLSGFAYQPSVNRTFMLPFLSDNTSTFITLLAQGSNVTINSYTADRSGFTTAYVYVDYWTD